MKMDQVVLLNYVDIDRHTDLSHENNKCSIILETVQAMAITFAVKIVRLKVYIIFSQSDDLDLHSRSKLRLRLHIIYFFTVFKLWHDGRYKNCMS